MYTTDDSKNEIYAAFVDLSAAYDGDWRKWLFYSTNLQPYSESSSFENLKFIPSIRLNNVKLG